jgi:hypothetical protein
METGHGMRSHGDTPERGVGMSKGSRRPSGASSRRAPRQPTGPQERPRASAQELASEREALWEASALSPATSVPQAHFSAGVRAALEQIFGADEHPLLGRVAERSVIYAAEARDNAAAGLVTLAAGYDMTAETLAARLDLPLEIVHMQFFDCPPALLAEVARALQAPLAEVSLAFATSRDSSEQRPQPERSFVTLISEAPSLSEEQRRHWLALLAADPA